MKYTRRMARTQRAKNAVPAYFNRKFDRLAKYAHDSGGDVYFGMKTHAMEEFYSRVAEEARNQDTLAYDSMGTNRGEEHRLERLAQEIASLRGSQPPARA